MVIHTLHFQKTFALSAVVNRSTSRTYVTTQHSDVLTPNKPFITTALEYKQGLSHSMEKIKFSLH